MARFALRAIAALFTVCMPGEGANMCRGTSCPAVKESDNVLLQLSKTSVRTSQPACPATEDGHCFGNVQTSQIDECSGLAASRVNPGMYWVNNDSGAGPTLYAIDRFGKHLARLRVHDSKANDWEDIAVGPGPEEGRSYIYIGDFGDNYRSRDRVHIYRVQEPRVPAGQDRNDDIDTNAQEFVIKYPDGAHDCEAMFIDQGPAATARGTVGRVYIISKGDNRNRDRRWAGGDVYYVDLPAQPSSSLEFVSTNVHLPVKHVTGADIAPSGSLIVVRLYEEVLMWRREGDSSVEEAMSSGTCIVSKKDERQGEAVAFGINSDHYITVSEGKYPAVWYFGLPQDAQPSSFTTTTTTTTASTTIAKRSSCAARVNAHACCGQCAENVGFCSPLSGTCYDSKKKEYYENCCEPDEAVMEPTSSITTTTTTATTTISKRSSCAARVNVHACCGQCSENGGFCSPHSGNCYESKKKEYYETCCESDEAVTEPTQPACCSNCAGKAYCSPGSGRCYDWKKKDYYAKCGAEA